MSDTETISVADVSSGVGGAANVEPGTPVELPVVEILTGRGFITGKSGSGKSNTASVVIENLLSNNFPVLIVDTDGEYYGLKEEFEVLHAGADDECDIQVSPEHAERIASLALEQNVPIILDVSGYLDESVAQELLLETTRQLFAKEKKLKKPFLMLIEECHEYIPEGGGIDETGKMLIKVGKRGRKHGLGIVGISQRPADVKKDFITQCDWLCWHRLTWRNDTKVVGRILGSEYADAIEEMGDGEAFLVTDWAESVRRVQFHRKQTFDAGATPGLEDFERPELKSVSADLVGELKTISDEEKRRESRLADLRQELDKKERKIADLEEELAEARDLKRMADRFSQALLSRADAGHRGGAGRNFARPDEKQAALEEYEDDSRWADVWEAEGADGGRIETGRADRSDPSADDRPAGDGGAEAGTDRSADEDDQGPLPAPEADVTTRPERYPSFAAVGARIESSLDRDSNAVRMSERSVSREAVVRTLVGLVEQLDAPTRRMLEAYRKKGTLTPVEAHVAATGAADEHLAYGRNRPLRVAGFVRHVDRDRYEYSLYDLVREEWGERLTSVELDATVSAVERSFLGTPEPADFDAASGVSMNDD